MLRPATLALVGLLALPSAGPLAQELRGTIRFDGSDRPAAGIIVEARDAASGSRIANALTSANGAFFLLLPAPATVVLRGLRIGHRPTDFGTFTIATGEVRILQLAVRDAPVQLARVYVVGRSVCGRTEGGGAQVLTLLEEARKALVSTQLPSLGGELSAVYTVRRELQTARGEARNTPMVVELRSRTDRPFQSLPADSLAKVGYFSNQRGNPAFYAPDADVLLSPQFAEAHCFRTVPWTRDDRDWVGVGFRPAELRRGYVDIEGTIWLDRQSAELRLLEYLYVNRPSWVPGKRTGGEVGFLRLETGAWLVHQWRIRSPHAELYRGRWRLYSYSVTGGDVREVRQGGRLLFVADSGGVPKARSSVP